MNGLIEGQGSDKSPEMGSRNRMESVMAQLEGTNPNLAFGIMEVTRDPNLLRAMEFGFNMTGKNWGSLLELDPGKAARVKEAISVLAQSEKGSSGKHEEERNKRAREVADLL